MSAIVLPHAVGSGVAYNKRDDVDEFRCLDEGRWMLTKRLMRDLRRKEY